MTKKELERRNCILLKCISFYIDYFKKETVAFQKGQFHFIPANLDRVLYLLNEVVEYYNKKGISIRSLKFLDAGCGIGNILTIANLMGFSAYGVEIDNRNIKIAKKLVTNPYEIYFKIIKGDILTFKDYSHYDVIYFYCPFCDHRKQEKFEAKIANDVKVGALVISCTYSSIFVDDPRFKYISRKKKSIWIKTKK